MSDLHTGLSGPSAPRRGSGSRGRLLTFGVILLILIVLGGLFVARSFYRAVWGFGKTMDATMVAPVLDGMETGNYQVVAEHVVMGGEGRDQDVSVYRSIGRFVSDVLGPCRSRKLINVSRTATKNGQDAKLVYEARYANDVARIDVELKERDGQWRLTGLAYSSRLLEENRHRFGELDTTGAAGID